MLPLRSAVPPNLESACPAWHPQVLNGAISRLLRGTALLGRCQSARLRNLTEGSSSVPSALIPASERGHDGYRGVLRHQQGALERGGGDPCALGVLPRGRVSEGRRCALSHRERGDRPASGQAPSASAMP